jgi:hypothetical protein
MISLLGFSLSQSKLENGEALDGAHLRRDRTFAAAALLGAAAGGDPGLLHRRRRDNQAASGIEHSLIGPFAVDHHFDDDLIVAEHERQCDRGLPAGDRGWRRRVGQAEAAIGNVGVDLDGLDDLDQAGLVRVAIKDLEGQQHAADGSIVRVMGDLQIFGLLLHCALDQVSLAINPDSDWAPALRRDADQVENAALFGLFSQALHRSGLALGIPVGASREIDVVGGAEDRVGVAPDVGDAGSRFHPAVDAVIACGREPRRRTPFVFGASRKEVLPVFDGADAIASLELRAGVQAVNLIPGGPAARGFDGGHDLDRIRGGGGGEIGEGNEGHECQKGASAQNHNAATPISNGAR